VRGVCATFTADSSRCNLMHIIILRIAALNHGRHGRCHLLTNSSSMDDKLKDSGTIIIRNKKIRVLRAKDHFSVVFSIRLGPSLALASVIPCSSPHSLLILILILIPRSLCLRLSLFHSGHFTLGIHSLFPLLTSSFTIPCDRVQARVRGLF